MSAPHEGPPAELVELLREIRPAVAADAAAVQAHLDDLTKPRGSLGRLEALALELACIYGDPPPPLDRATVVVMAADHGVARRGVSAYPPEVTAQMCRNFAAGGAAINVIAGAVGAAVLAVDVGVDTAGDPPAGVRGCRVRRGTRDLAEGPALTRKEVLQAIGAGVAIARELAAENDLLMLGDMGIGNTTAAACVTAALTGEPAEAVVGPGTGIDAARMARKREVVAGAAARVPATADVVDVLAEVGGLEIAALAGVVLGAARSQMAVLADGFITTAAALAAVRMCGAARGYVVASHLSREPGHAVQLGALGLTPLLDLELRLGEGTGAALALPLLRSAAALLRGMATFSSAGVSGRESVDG